MLKQITPNLMTEDVDRTIAFYIDHLGFTLKDKYPEQGAAVWAELKRDDVTLMFQSRQSMAEEIPALQDVPIGTSQTFYTVVEDIDALHAELQGKVEIVQAMHTTFYGAKEFSFKDCNGYIFAYAEATSA
ncbi:MAG TPA: VOC family protein [Chthonomonadaceae bacterium]|nr:VOC family protein [Chthonomonadaceae bacterium]